jgi:uncharacterized protein (TIGR02246 family)
MSVATDEKTNSPVNGADVAAVAGVAQRIVAAWANQDADAFAAVFSDNGSMVLPGDVYKKNRDEIRTYMAGAFEGPYKGTQVTGLPLGVRFITPDVAIMVTQGGVVAAGQKDVAPDQLIRATWVAVREGDGWQLAAYHNSPLHTG